MRSGYLGHRFLRDTWLHLLNQRAKPLCTGHKPGGGGVDNDAYRQLEKLDFMTAAKMLFTKPPKEKKFGLDFHLVQLFFACMPSLAVYLVAQYARYEIRRMEAEVELKKKKAEGEEKEKEMDSDNTKEGSASELLEVKARLDELEVAVKEIIVESKKLTVGNITKDQEGSKKEQPNLAESNIKDKSKHNNSAPDDPHSRSKTIESRPDLSGERVVGSSHDHKNQGVK